MLTVTRIIHSTVLIDFDGNTILTDPWFSQQSGYRWKEPLGITVDALPHLTGVFVSHKHFDHYDMKAFKSYSDKSVPFAVKRGIAKAARKAGFKNVTELDAGETTTLGPVRVTATPAKHAAPEITCILSASGFSVYFGGDTLFIPELAELSKKFQSIDLALLPISGLTGRLLGNRKIVMSAEDAAELCAILRPRVAVPIHYGYTAGPIMDRILLKYNGSTEQFVQAVGKLTPGTIVRILEPGESLQLTAP
jgi:L-ascorbate metabolism protein UlaG (beta-lactamase superfamily)